MQAYSVKVGQRVKRGELVAIPNGSGANIHASLSGVIEEVAPNSSS